MKSPRSNLRPTHRFQRRAFTAMELLMALGITIIILLTLSAVMASVAQGWTFTENTQGYVLAETAGMHRIERLLRDARLTGAYSTGPIDDSKAPPAYMVLWAQDRQGNEKIEIGEIAVLEHDPRTNTVRVWEIPGETPLHDQTNYQSVLGDPSNIDTFKQIAQARPRTLAVNVKSMALWVHSPTADQQQPTVEYALTFVRPSRRGNHQTDEVTLYGSATLRAPNPSAP